MERCGHSRCGHADHLAGSNDASSNRTCNNRDAPGSDHANRDSPVPARDSAHNRADSGAAKAAAARPAPSTRAKAEVRSIICQTLRSKRQSARKGRQRYRRRRINRQIAIELC